MNWLTTWQDRNQQIVEVMALILKRDNKADRYTYQDLLAAETEAQKLCHQCSASGRFACGHLNRNRF